MLTALLAAAATTEASSASSIDNALTAALNFDERAYYQICGKAARKARFTAMQKRAADLDSQLAKIQGNDAISWRYVDRRAKGVCQNPERFDDTIRQWSKALDMIEQDMRGLK